MWRVFLKYQSGLIALVRDDIPTANFSLVNEADTIAQRGADVYMRSNSRRDILLDCACLAATSRSAAGELERVRMMARSATPPVGVASRMRCILESRLRGDLEDTASLLAVCE